MNPCGGDFDAKGTVMTRIDKIEQVLKAGKKITPLTAIQICGSMRLAAVIHDLKNKRGLDIRTTMRTDTQGCEYAEYHMFFSPMLMTA